MKNNSVLVLLSTYNGERYLEELLNSVLNQEKCNCSILIRDDGSTDNTVNILKKYEKEYDNIKFYQGNNLGYAKSFWDLIKKSGEFDYYAFCDQDDIWKTNKLERAINLIEKNKEYNEQAVLYTSNVICVNDNMEKLNNTAFFCEKPLNVYKSFQKSILPGCTYVFNFSAREILKKYDGFMESHDWAAYIIINVFGKVVYDSKSYIYYRIHEQNTIGISTKVERLKIKFKRFFSKNKNTRSKFAKDFYETYSTEMENEELKANIEQLAYYKQKILLKIKLLLNKNYKGFIFKVYVLLNKV